MKFALSQQDVSGLSDDQKGAIFAALVAAIFADGRIDKPEIAKFEEELGLVPWGKDNAALTAMVAAARARVQQIHNEQEVMAFVDDVAAKLPNQELREKVLRMMGSVMFSDRELVQEEKNLLGAFAMAFNIPGDRIEALRQEILGKN